MSIGKKLGKLAGKIFQPKEPEEYYDNETRDKYLRSLRRERRIQLEEEEKIALKRAIAEYKKRKREENLWGTQGKPILRENNMLKSEGSTKQQKWFGKL